MNALAQAWPRRAAVRRPFAEVARKHLDDELEEPRPLAAPRETQAVAEPSGELRLGLSGSDTDGAHAVSS